MKRKRNTEEGLLSLEASITLTIFMFLMFFLYSFFVVFEARNEIAHVLLSTADSLSLDIYKNEELKDANTLSQALVGGVICGLYYGNSDYDIPASEFVNDTWETSDESLQSIIQARFIAYLTAGGNVESAEEILKRYHVKGGVGGLDFSASRVEEDKLYLSVRYTLEYEFHVFNGGEETFEQSVCSKIWK